MSAMQKRAEYLSTHEGLPSKIPNGTFYRKLAKKIGIDSYAKYFGCLTMTETWERLVHYEGELPPPTDLERTVPQPSPKQISPQVGIKKPTPMKEYHPNSAKAQINMATDITPESILQLPMLPLSSPQLLPDSRGLFFVMASEFKSQVIYAGKSQNLKVSWKPVYSRHKSPIAAHRRREATLLANLGFDVYIRWIPLIAAKESSAWQKDTDGLILSLWLAHANKVLSPFFLGREIGDETTLDWDLLLPRHWQKR
jgi:hypothetical protein